MREWLIKYWIEVLFGVIISGVTVGYKRLSCKIKDKTKEQEAIKLGMQALLRNAIIDSFNHYQEKDYCPIYARENVEALYVPYHALGGNGTVTELIEKIRNLPTEKRVNKNVQQQKN